MKRETIERIVHALNKVGVPVRIIRLETLVQMKLRAGRPQDRADVAQLRQIHGDTAHD